MTYKVLMGTLNPTHLFIHSLETFFGKSYSPLGHELQHLVTLRAKPSGAVYCYRSCLFVCVFVCLWVCYHDNHEIVRIDLHHTGSVGEGSDYLQLIKFLPSCAPRKGVCGGANFFGSVLLQPARSVCISSERFFIF